MAYYFLLAIVMNLLATYLCRDGTPVPLRKGSPLTVGLPYIFVIFHTETWPFSPRSCLVLILYLGMLWLSISCLIDGT